MSGFKNISFHRRRISLNKIKNLRFRINVLFKDNRDQRGGMLGESSCIHNISMLCESQWICDNHK